MSPVLQVIFLYVFICGFSTIRIGGHATLSVSPSTFAGKSDVIINKKTVHKSPLYSHWFAIEIYDQVSVLKFRKTRR